MNELATNLVPFPRLHYLTAGFAPMLSRGASSRGRDEFEALDSQVFAHDAVARRPRDVQRLFREACGPNARVVRSFEHDAAAIKRKPATLACALLARGDIEASDVNACIEKLRPTLRAPDGVSTRRVCDFEQFGRLVFVERRGETGVWARGESMVLWGARVTALEYVASLGNRHTNRA